jgi:hypothetical protein
VIEVNLPMTPAMMQIQARLLVLISLCLQEIQRASKLPKEATNIDNLLLRQFDYIVHSQLAVRLCDASASTLTCRPSQPMWYALGEKTRRLISDVRSLRHLLLLLPSVDACEFLRCWRSCCEKQPAWADDVAARDVDHIAQARVYVRVAVVAPTPTPVPAARTVIDLNADDGDDDDALTDASTAKVNQAAAAAIESVTASAATGEANTSTSTRARTATATSAVTASSTAATTAPTATAPATTLRLVLSASPKWSMLGTLLQEIASFNADTSSSAAALGPGSTLIVTRDAKQVRRDVRVCARGRVCVCARERHRSVFAGGAGQCSAGQRCRSHDERCLAELPTLGSAQVRDLMLSTSTSVCVV